MSSKKIIYTGSFRFPDKDAASQRVLGIAKALREAGFDTIFCGWEKSPRSEDLETDGLYRFSDFEYHSQAELDLVSNNSFQRLFRFLFRGSKTIRWIKNYVNTNEINFVLVYNSNTYFIYKLFLLSKKMKFKLVCDCTEWYDGNHLPGGKYGIVNLDNNIRIKIIYPLIRNVIVISSFLQNYLQKKGCHTIIVPPLIDMDDSKWKTVNNNIRPSLYKIIKIIYAGDPGKKDLLKSVFSALEFMNTGLIKFEFHVLGIDLVPFKKYFFPGSKGIPSYVHCIGRVSQHEVPKYYHQCHFSVLFRENKRYAHAGFPTKLVESLSSGVPVITNCTSDIPNYIIHGENGFLLKDTTDLVLIKCFHQILSLTENEAQTMRENAKKSSVENFDIHVYSHQLKYYLLNLR
ncbi:MAG: glycosyltransferase [Ferruginibacter sp.]